MYPKDPISFEFILVSQNSLICLLNSLPKESRLEYVKILLTEENFLSALNSSLSSQVGLSDLELGWKVINIFSSKNLNLKVLLTQICRKDLDR